MKNNFDLTNYMKSNKVGAYQQLNEMWYSDMQAIGQPLGMRHTAINEEEAVEEQEMKEGKKKLAFVIPCPDCYDIEEEAEYFQHLLDKAGVKAKVKANQVGEEAEVYTKDEKKARKVIEKNGYQIGWNDEVEDNGQGESMKSDDQEQSHYLDIPTGPDKGWKNEDDLKEMGGVKSIGDAGKMATPNSRPNLGRHRSSDMLDKMSKKDHKTNTVVGAKAAAYKAPHMKEEEEMFGAEPEGSNLQSYIEDLGDNASAEDLLNYYQENGLAIGEMQELMNHYGISVEQLALVFKDLKMNMLNNMNKTGRNKKMYEDETDDIFAGSDAANFKDNYGNDASEWDTNIAGQTVEGWTADETQGGAISWQNPKYPHTIVYATPGWEGVNGIAFEVYSDPEDGWNGSIGPMMQKVIGSHTDLWKTEKGYLALLGKAFTELEMKLTPSVDMDENYMGTQYGSSEDMAVDMIKKGITEDEDPEHMVKNEGVQDWNHTWEEDIADLLDDGVSKPEILTHFKDILKNADSRMEESIEDDADPFGSIKTGIDKITQGDDDDMDMSDDDRFSQLGGDKIKAGIESLMGDGFDFREILQFVKDTIASKRNY
jgi:hypothetical protein